MRLGLIIHKPGIELIKVPSSYCVYFLLCACSMLDPAVIDYCIIINDTGKEPVGPSQ